MANVERLRGRLPLIAFILLAIVVVMLLGFACACLTEDPMQTVERVVSLAPALPAAPDTWVGLFAALATSLLIVRTVDASGRASPALLQRFRF